MRLLLDTHALLWALTRPESLSPRTRSLVGDATTRVYASAVAIQEVAIKTTLGKLRLDEPPERLFPRAIAESGFDWLPITPAHALALTGLPFFPDHRDPFDRQLIAQARVEGLCLVTRDQKIIDGRYGIDFVVA